MDKVDWAALQRQMEGDLCTDSVNRWLLSTDASIFRIVPAAVAYPRTCADVGLILDFARLSGLGVHARGAGSGLCGSAIGQGIVIDFTRYMNRLLHLDVSRAWFECEPGYRLGELEQALAGSGLFFPPDPSSGEYATFGGMVNTNASGAHSVKYGTVADYFRDAELILGTGDRVHLRHIARADRNDLIAPLQQVWSLYEHHAATIEGGAYPAVRFNSTGYNLRGLVRSQRLHLSRLLAGSEGTLAIATQLAFNLVPKPPVDSLVVAFFKDMASAVTAVARLLALGPAGIEMMDKSLLDLAGTYQPLLKQQLRADAACVLLIDFDGFEAAACRRQAEEARTLLTDICTEAFAAADAAAKKRFWALRKAAVPILYKLEGKKRILALVEDAAVPTDRLPAYVEGIYAIMADQGVNFVLYGHIAKGLLHTRPLLDLKDRRDVAKLKSLADAIFELVERLGGAISGEHGDGRLRSAYVPRQYPTLYPIFQAVKHCFDPQGLLNPRIITGAEPDQMVRDLRFGGGYEPLPQSPPLLRWPEGYATEVEKCHGCTRCTTVTTATRMCPVFKFTRKEAAAPKAKANLLFALLSGADVAQSVFDRSVQQVMDLCINCGSCAVECPSAVNIPKLTLEARARYTARFGPSLSSRFLAEVEWAGRITHRFARPLNRMANTPLMRRLMEVGLGLSVQRQRVGFHHRSLYDRVDRVEGSGATRVLYFAGCYAGYVRPEIGQAAVNVMSHLGLTVKIPDQHCCGLPLLSKAMAAGARAKMRQNLKRWGAVVADVDHIVVTCSSCGLALIKEWPLLADDPALAVIKDKLVHVSRLLKTRLQNVSLADGPPLRLAYHRPCHLNVQPDPDCSLHLLSQIKNIAVTELASHCCGMAGSWGLAKANAALSLEMGSDLMARIGDSRAQMVATDCPTCRMQITELGHWPVAHPVEIAAAALGLQPLGSRNRW
jgi:FAD/FMN-containing dehydrogenase/Fe-S oxidoreductase